jgi:hypothetical protein
MEWLLFRVFPGIVSHHSQNDRKFDEDLDSLIEPVFCYRKAVDYMDHFSSE